MEKKILIGSIIAVALLTLVSFSSVVGYNSVKNTQEEIITDEWDFEYCKNYLFETIIEISNNEDVSDLINSNNQNLLPTNSNHRILMPFRRNTNRMSLSVEKLDLLYNMGLRIIDRLGEEKVAEIMETTSIDKPEFADELDTIIMGNDELRDRIYTLNKMNGEEVTDFNGFSIICFILYSMLIVTNLLILPVNILVEILSVLWVSSNFFICIFLISPLLIFTLILEIPLIFIYEIIYILYTIFDCPEL